MLCLPCRVRYIDREGNHLAATVVAVDKTVQPHSYAVKIHSLGSVRETEAFRLLPALVGRSESDAGGPARGGSGGR
jgi:hypothetical protein